MHKLLYKISTIVLFTIICTLVADPVRAQEPPGTIVRVMTYNACRGGTYQGQPLSQSAKMIKLAKADIVGLQEIGENVPMLAEMLGGTIVARS